MSYDIDVILPGRDACATCGRSAEIARSVAEWNCTRQAAYVYRDAGIDFMAFHERPTIECVPVLRGQLARFAENPGRFMSASNTALFAINLESDSGLVGILRRLLLYFERHPDGTVRVQR